jgi:hypothetical protein
VVAYATAIDVTRVRFLGDVHHRFGISLAPSFMVQRLEYPFAIEGSWVRHLVDATRSSAIAFASSSTAWW